MSTQDTQAPDSVNTGNASPAVSTPESATADGASESNSLKAILRDQIKAEKDLLPLLSKDGVKRLLKGKQKKYWHTEFMYINALEFLDMTTDRENPIPDSYEGFHKISGKIHPTSSTNNGFAYVICKKCFNEE